MLGLKHHLKTTEGEQSPKNFINNQTTKITPKLAPSATAKKTSTGLRTGIPSLNTSNYAKYG